MLAWLKLSTHGRCSQFGSSTCTWHGVLDYIWGFAFIHLQSLLQRAAMSQLEHFDGLVGLFNSSVKLIRDHLASRQVNDHTEFGGGHQSTAFPLASAPENVRNANKSMLEAMAKIQQMFIDPVEHWSQTTINVSEHRSNWHMKACNRLAILT